MIKVNQKGNAQGNAMVYILIAVALFGALTLTLSRQNDSADGQNIDDEQVELYVLELIEYVGSAQNVINMMLATGTEVGELDFINPSSAAFNTPPHIHKVFHPQGGGLNQPNISAKMSNNGVAGNWRFKANNNVEWTKTIAADVIISNQFLKSEICAAYNKSVTGSENIPVLSNTLNHFFAESFNNDFNIADCNDCEGYTTLCVQSNSGNSTGIYNIIVGQ